MSLSYISFVTPVALFQLIISATDSLNSTLISRRTLIVNLLDKNDNFPTFAKTNYSACPTAVSPHLFLSAYLNLSNSFFVYVFIFSCFPKSFFFLSFCLVLFLVSSLFPLSLFIYFHFLFSVVFLCLLPVCVCACMCIVCLSVSVFAVFCASFTCLFSFSYFILRLGQESAQEGRHTDVCHFQ